MSRLVKISITVIAIILTVVCFRLFLMGYYYDFLEYWTLRDKIVWSKTTKLKWSDFHNSDEGIGLYAKVGLSSRYNVNDPILFRSKTVFIPKESYVTDTTIAADLRVAQAKFDLLEVFRRKMESEVDSIRKSNTKKYKPSDFKKMNRRYYEMFDTIWQEFKDSENKLEKLERIERLVYLKLNNITESD
ncbi:hypothetical protein [Flagellimonas lutimaris]|uniref:hypothetical protein n=1 Tax=Flagellimonas lutimaris TaxID=475082 RepID=UPI003F5CC07F